MKTSAIHSQLVGNGFEDGPEGCVFAWKNSVMGDAPESFEVREDKLQTISRVFRKE
jgi:hypothetical protein